jgi:hypothetical protein
MRKRDRVTYLVLLSVAAIEDHMARPHAGHAGQARERALSERALQPAIQPGRQGGLTR